MQSTRFSANLDILRALAVLIVLFAHGLDTVMIQQPQLGLHTFTVSVGRLGVLMFFVHTALVLNFSMERMQLADWGAAAAFYTRRFFRLYPLAMLCVLLALAMQAPPMPWDTFEMPAASAVLSNLALITNLTLTDAMPSPLWTLAVEAQMYVALPAIFIIVRKRPRIAIAIWLASVPIAWFQPDISERLNTLAYVPCFMGGVLAYTLSEQRRWQIHSACWLPALLALCIVYVIAQSMAHPRFAPTGWIACLILGAGIPLFLDSGAARLNEAAALLAKYSYGIYLFHPLALWIGCVYLDHLPTWLQWTAALVMLIAMAGAGYHYIEKPAIDYGLRVADRMKVARLAGQVRPG